MRWFSSITVIVVGSVVLACASTTPANARPDFHPLARKPEPAPEPPASPTPEQLRDATVPGNYDKPVLLPRPAMGHRPFEQIAGTTWNLVAFGDERLASGSRPPTIVFLDDRVAGFSGCNRYMGEAKELAPGTMTFGPLAGTRMACPDDETGVEDRFLAALQAVTRYALDRDNLVLSTDDGDRAKSLVFEKAPELRD